VRPSEVADRLDGAGFCDYEIDYAAGVARVYFVGRESVKKVNVSKHAVKRWRERVNPDAGEEQAAAEIERALREGTVVWEENEEGVMTQYVVHGDTMLIHAPEMGTVVTTIKVDFGFSEEINRELCRMQVEHILELGRRVKEEGARLAEAEREFDRELALIDSEIAGLEARLEAARAAQRRVAHVREEARRRYEALKKEHEREFHKLKYSVGYRLEALREKHAKEAV